MSLIKELSKESLLVIALKAVAGMLTKEIELTPTLAVSETHRAELMRKATGQGRGGESQPLKFPYSFLLLNSLAGIRDTGNNYAVRKHGLRLLNSHTDALTKKAYLFPIKIGLELHYIDTDPGRLLNMALALATISASSGLKCDVNIGESFTFSVALEIPLESTIQTQEEQSGVLPEASELTAQIIVSTEAGFFRDVSAVNGTPAKITAHVTSGVTATDTELRGFDYALPW